MIREQRQLLIKDLCARLPYYVQCYSNVADHNWCILTPVVISNLFNATEDLVLKPYLRPMSSMTAEEKKFYNELSNDVKMYFGVNAESQACSNLVNWLNSHHFDYRGLINKGLALEAPEGMYKIQ